MKRYTPMTVRRWRRSAGVGLVTAIFLLVVIAGMGAAMVTLVTSQQSGAALDLLGARAYQAARAGVEFGLFQQRRLGNCPAAPTSFALPAGTSLSNFSVTVACSSRAVGAVVVYQVTATACNFPGAAGQCPNPGNQPDYVQRVVTVQF